MSFPFEEGLPPDIQNGVGYWAQNLEGIPHPIREMHGHLLEEDIDILLWSHHVAPKQHRNEFLDMLWNIFVIPDAWANLVVDTWIVPMNQVLCDLPMDVFWEWPPQVTPCTLDSSHEMAQPKSRGYPHPDLTTPRALCQLAKPGLLLQPQGPGRS